MGQAFDRDGELLGEAYGATKREVFEKLNQEFKDAHEIRVMSVKPGAVGEDGQPANTGRDPAPFAGGPSVEMPRYRCHKDVWALKIVAVVDPTQPGNESDGSRIISFADEGYASMRVDRDYVHKHNPRPGGYYVVYKDGYKSFSPADAFEDGYTRL